MKIQSGGVALALALATGSVALGGCVTIDSFDKHIDEINQRHNALAARVDELNGKVDSLAARGEAANRANQAAAQAAQQRADAAYTLAQGKFVMTEVGRESVNFATGKWSLSTEAQMTLSSLAERLKSENKNVFLEVRGHADVRGGKQMNRSLGRERAGAVARFLSDQGVPGNRIQIGSWGEDNPKNAGKSSEANAENRRVEIVILQ